MKMAIYQNLIGCNLDYDFFFFFSFGKKDYNARQESFLIPNISDEKKTRERQG